MLVALPEIDGAANPTVFAGRHGERGLQRLRPPAAVRRAPTRPWRPALSGSRSWPRRRCASPASAARSPMSASSGSSSSASRPTRARPARRPTFRSSRASTTRSMPSVTKATTASRPRPWTTFRKTILEGNAAQYGQEANVAAQVMADDLVADCPWLSEIEEVWGPAPGRVQSDGRGVFVLGHQLRQCLRRCPARLRIRGRPDAAPLSRRASRRPTPSPPSTAGSGRSSAPMRSSISGCMARSSSCPASRPVSRAPAGPTG